MLICKFCLNCICEGTSKLPIKEVGPGVLGYIFNPSTHKTKEGKSFVISSTAWSKHRDSEQAGLYSVRLCRKDKKKMN